MKRIVILIEDDNFLREILHEKLLSAGYDVTTLEDGQHALETIVEKMPDVVLLDIMMPNKDGFEVLAELKNEVRTGNIPVIVLSNLGQQEDIHRAKDAGATEFLTKANFMPEEIVAKIEELLAGK